MTRSFDVIVVGLGAMGAATLRALARRGVAALGIDRYAPPHELGSSHGETRATRVAVGEGDVYVPMVRRSHAIWRDLEGATGLELLDQCGFLIIDETGGDSCLHGLGGFFERTIGVAGRNGVAHEALDAPALRSRFRAHAVQDHARGYLEPEGGLVHAERAIIALLRDAAASGATIRTGVSYLGHHRAGSGVEVATTQGAISAARVVLAAGPWLPELVPALRTCTRRLRQVLHWFGADVPAAVDSAAFPVFLRLHGPRAEDAFYSFPDVDAGVKLATEQYARASARADEVERAVMPGEAAAFERDHLAGRMGPALRLLRSAACVYTVTPVAQFVVDRAPDDGRAIMVSACSGHGFKHAPAVGEMVAEAVASDGPLPPEFALDRPALLEAT